MTKRAPWAERYGGRAVITGAGSGIGASFASRCVEASFDVVLVDRDTVALERLATTLRAIGKGSVTIFARSPFTSNSSAFQSLAPG